MLEDGSARCEAVEGEGDSRVAARPDHLQRVLQINSEVDRLPGASLKDPALLFNSILDGNVRRVIDLQEGVAVDPDPSQALIRAAGGLITSGGKVKPRQAK